MQQSRSLVALFALLVTIFIATSCVEGTKFSARQTNADRLRRNLGPLPPVRRKPSGVLTARQTDPSATATTGRAAIVLADGTTLGHLSATDPSAVDATSTTRRKRNLATRAGDVILHFVEGTGTGNGSLLAQNALYSPPYLGQSNATLSGQILFTNVAEGKLSTLWSLNQTSGALAAQWTNPDGSLPDTYILYKKDTSQLVFSDVEKVTGMEVVTLTLGA